jgi:hypothetical protein
MSGRNSLTGYGVPSGNSIVGDTLTLSAERSIDMLALLAPSAASTADPSAASQLLVEYADRFRSPSFCRDRRQRRSDPSSAMCC